MAENTFQGIEISDDLMGIITGGMTEQEKYNIDSFVYLWKKTGMSLERVLEKFSFLEGNENADEYYDYITQCYNSIQF